MPFKLGNLGLTGYNDTEENGCSRVSPHIFAQITINYEGLGFKQKV